MSNRKLEIVSRLIDLIPDQGRETIDQAMISWWVNIRNTGGLRLTWHGYNLLKNIIGIESWSVDISDAKKTFTKRVILDLDHKLNWPYYVDPKNKRIVFFSSREAVMATLYGDLQAWLKGCEVRTS